MRNPRSTDRLIPSEDVLLDLRVSDRNHLFEAVSAVWGTNPGAEATQIVESLNARELLGSTALGEGVAIPHARSAVTTGALTAFVRTASPLEFDAPDTLPVDCFVFLLVPQHAVSVHLELLVHLARKLSGGSFRERIRAARTPEQVSQLFAADPGGSGRRSDWSAMDERSRHE